MTKQVAAIVAAGILALLGVVALVQYANDADDRAQEGTRTVTVLRAIENVPAATPVAELGDKFEKVKLPQAAVIKGALTDLEGLDGQVLATRIVVGDQLSDAKFTTPDKLKEPLNVPDGLQSVALPLDNGRVGGPELAAGDKVGVFVSYPGVTANPINGLLVLDVQNGFVGDKVTEGKLVTVAADTATAQKLVHALEFGTIVLAIQNDKTVVGESRTIGQQDVAP